MVKKIDLNTYGFLVLEKYLRDRYQYFNQNFSSSRIILDLDTMIKNNLILNFFARLKKLRELRLVYETNRKKFIKKKILFLSNSEGFISSNISCWIKEDNPEIILVTLQHGFIIEESQNLLNIKMLFSSFVKFIFGYYIFGSGFINKKIDYYIVVNRNIKKYLSDRGVDNNKITVSAKILKPEIFHNIIKKRGEGRNALFLLQPLYESGITTSEYEKYIVNRTIEWLLERHDLVYVKQHPFKKVKYTTPSRRIIEVKSDIITMLNKAHYVYSFFSEGLLEAEFMGADTCAIYSDEFKSRKQIYKYFSRIAYVRKSGNFDLSTNKRMSTYYENGVENINGLTF